MAGRLQDKVVLITGAGSVGPGWGNGKAAAVLYAREGARVFAADIDLDAARETQSLIAEEGGAAEICQADATDSDAVAAMVRACTAAFGRIDVLHNNVGGSAPGGPVEMPEEVWDHQIDMNLKSVYLACKHALPVMEAQGRGGSVVNIASIAGLRHMGNDHVAYAASKAGLIQLSRHLAVKYAARNIRFNTVIPGLMHTPLVEARLAGQYAGGEAQALIDKRNAQVPMGRMGDAWDVAYAALYFASDESKYVTGAEILVDGGLTARAR